MQAQFTQLTLRLDTSFSKVILYVSAKNQIINNHTNGLFIFTIIAQCFLQIIHLQRDRKLISNKIEFNRNQEKGSHLKLNFITVYLSQSFCVKNDNSISKQATSDKNKLLINS